MKQIITVEQLMELTEEQKQRLRELWKREFGDVFYITDYKDNKEAQMQVMDRVWQLIVKDYRKEFLPLLSIGQMIELLIQHHGEYWSDSISKINGTTYSKNIYFTYEDELCDALWQAVKQVL
jgi:hypothetical protein